MAFRFASISEMEFLSMNEEAVPKNTKVATKFGVTAFNGKLFKTSFFFNFEQLRLPAAKNPIRACAHMLPQDQNIALGYYCVVVEEQMKVLLSASVSQLFYTEIVISNSERKVCNALKNILMR